MISARSVAQRLAQHGLSAHLVWNPADGEIVQMVPATESAVLLDHGVGREGRVCLQIVVVGVATEPFTDGPLNGLARIVAWLDGWRVPRRWPAGPPLPSPEAYQSTCGRRAWARGGYFGASQVPYATGPSPGAIDVERIITPGGLPRPRLAAREPGPATDPDALFGRRLGTPPPRREHEPARNPT